MADNDWVAFLQWALPRLHMRWAGFRKVRGQVIKRLAARLQQLDLPDPHAYRDFLEQQPTEWPVLDRMCRVTISRFYRDRQMLVLLEQEVLPEIADRLSRTRKRRMRVWSAGCANGEEPYTVAIVWLLRLASRFSSLDIDILATDADAALLKRAAAASYPHSSIKNLPLAWRAGVFDKRGDTYDLRQRYRAPVRFLQHDIRSKPPAGPFHLILCRNLVFTYFSPELQRRCLQDLHRVLAPDGYLIVSPREQLPEPTTGFTAVSRRLGVYRRMEKGGSQRYAEYT